LAAYLFVNYDPTVFEPQFLSEFSWLSSLGIQLSSGLTGIAAPLVLLNGIVFFAAVFISKGITERPKEFYVLLMVLAAGVYGVFISLDLFFFFFFYELAVVPMYLLIGVWGSSTDFTTFVRTKEYGAMKLTLYLVGGSVLVWIAIIGVWLEAHRLSGEFTFAYPILQTVQFSGTFELVFFPLFMIGFGILAGLWPFHTWSPDGHVAAPTAVSMMHAGVLMKLGAFGILQIGVAILPNGAHAWAPFLIALGTVNILYGAVSALAQNDLKYIVGYSSVSHMGYVLVGLATLDPLGLNGAVLQMFSHGVMTALLFAVVGSIYERTHTRDVTSLEGLSKKMGAASILFTIAGLTSIGLPGFSGFVAELLIFIAAFRTYPIVAILAIIGAAISAVYVLRLLGKVFWGPLRNDLDGVTDASTTTVLTSSVLVVFLLLWGIYPWPILKIVDSGLSSILLQLPGN